MFLHRLVPWPSLDIQVNVYGDRPRETPPSRVRERKVKHKRGREVTKYSDFGHIEGYISETVQDMR